MSISVQLNVTTRETIEIGQYSTKSVKLSVYTKISTVLQVITAKLFSLLVGES